MKVLCIDTSGLAKDKGFVLEEGVVYEPLPSPTNDPKYADAYLIHVNEDYFFFYSKSRFIPLSDIDETEIASIREQDKLYH